VAQAGDVRLLARPAAAAGLVWTLRSDGRAVLGLDPVTLAVKVTVRVSATTGVATQGKATVVVGANRQVSFVRDGQVVRRLDVDGQLSGLAVSPDGTRLYVAIQEGGAPGPGRIETLDPRTGAALAAPVPTGGTPGGLQATAGGLWLTSSSGMHSGMAFLPDGANRLRPVNAGQSGGGLLTRPAFSDGAVWLGSYGTLGCADPGTGAIRARVPVGTDKRGDVIAGVSGLAALGGKVYAVYSGVNGGPESALIVMTPPAACFGN
jgi:DNA-binding beta-propeller fold protein YncE